MVPGPLGPLPHMNPPLLQVSKYYQPLTTGDVAAHGIDWSDDMELLSPS